MATYRELPDPIPNRVITTPDGPITILSKQPVLRCDGCGENYSANRGDYWDRLDQLACCGECGDLLRLCREYVSYEDVPGWEY